ncbi:protein SIEVE ELEMENT OCCLUSION B-like [Quercus lobata]|uniref:Sieve element occlusion n=1 Tax=Quercus lobata TaxID=97700 RepID=A0A7N2LMR9_QUELO|nr:protein SIEVE ELEMENT OCCLUSION B-like [Quercus lobata]
MACNKKPFQMTDDEIKKEISVPGIHTAEKFDVASLFAIVTNILKPATIAADNVFRGTKQQHMEIKGERVIATSFIPPLCTLKELSYEMVCKDPSEETAYKTTKSILEKLKDYSWHVKAVLTLAAFTLDYGDFCRHLDQFHSSDQLTKSMGILKGIPALLTRPSIDHNHEGAIVEVNKLIKDTLNVIDCIVTLEERSVKYNPKDVPALSIATDNISVYVFWAIITVVVCTTRMCCLIKDERKTQELSRFAEKINVTHVKLKLQIQLCNEEIEKIEAYWKLIRFLKEPLDIVEVLKVLFFANDSRQQVKVFPNELILEAVKTKKVLLFFSGLDVDNITEYVSILNPIYEKVTSNNEYKIVWIPIVEQWTIEMQKKFELLRSKMSWFVVQNFSSISAIKYVKEQWHYKNEPIIVALNSQGTVEHYNAVHMIKIWGPSAFPFTHRRDEELRKREDWFGSLMIEFSTDISTWIKEEKHIFFYGGKDSTWIKEFCKEATGLANDDVKGARISLFNVGKDSGIQRRFWKLIDNFFLYKSHMVTDVDTVTKEIQKLLSYKNEKGWVVLCKGARLVFSGYGSTVLTVLKNFDEWKQCLKESAFSFEACLEKYYNEQLRKDGLPCRDFDIPKIDGLLIPDCRKCPDCSEIMEMSIRFKCCHQNQRGFNLNCCHNNGHATKVQLKEKVSPVSLVCGMTVTAACESHCQNKC